MNRVQDFFQKNIDLILESEDFTSGDAWQDAKDFFVEGVNTGDIEIPDWLLVIETPDGLILQDWEDKQDVVRVRTS